MRELSLLQHIYEQSTSLPARVVIPPGDDMGAIRLGDRTVLVTVDQLADGVHVDIAAATLQQVGRKAITRNLSDVAAMAARPVAAVVAGALPRDFGEARANALFDAMRSTADAYDCPLIGGDITIYDRPLMLTVTVLAEPFGGIEPVLRRGAKVGDLVCVTGALGGSLQAVDGVVHHLDFEPRLRVAKTLASGPARPTAMLDLSDGLAQDLPRLCRLADTSAVIDAARLPISEAARRAARSSGQSPATHAVADGEDYELCFTIAAAAATDLPADVDGVAITVIGEMVARRSDGLAFLRDDCGELQCIDDRGWEHHGS